MDQVSVKKVASLAFLLVIMLLMALPPALALPPAPAPAPTLMKKNNNGTTVGCNNGIMEEEEGEETCRLIANDYLDMEFMMGSGISRMLDEQSEYYVFLSSQIQKAPANCGRENIPGNPYTPCSPPPRPRSQAPPRPCSKYFRKACN